MKITDMVITPIAFADPPLLNAAGLHAPFALRIILEIKTDEGISGVGEIAGGSSVLDSLQKAKNTIIGMNPFERNAIRRAIDTEFSNIIDSMTVGYSHKAVSVRMFSAIDVALYDIIGKALGKPVVDLLGGRVRERVDFSAYLFYKYEGAGGTYGFGRNPNATGWHKEKEEAALDPDGIVSQAEAMCNEFGFKSIKLKAGVFEPQLETDTIFALRTKFGESYPLRIDPNAVWSLETSIRYGRMMEDVLEYYEDPCKTQELMSELRKQVSIPMATNMCTTSFDELPKAVSLGSEDIILADHHIWGGLDATMQLGRICSTFGRGLSMHSNSHLGISLTAMTHLGCALPGLSYAMDTHYPWQSEEVIKGGRIQFEDGSLGVSNEPGLGIELDYTQLEKLHQNYLNCGIIDRNDEIEMQKVNPEWQFSKHYW
ncbi:enolase C-terminal domain-like protein [uncultured Sphaerochaeta sp.]|uniref:enolase C-terminal domain-like protein n=1 Tax=uncultured Sphaerochaeta sp. TaxID=886478 RepID=UPI002AA7B526|nr:enolase C-terminal domain-like protein [uncultured Sphaerochaeta sp.]